MRALAPEGRLQLATPQTTAMKIAIQGELGSFSHEAAEAMVRGAKVVPCARSLEVFERVTRGTVAGAVIPIENSLAGSVAEHFDLLLSRQVRPLCASSAYALCIT